MRRSKCTTNQCRLTLKGSHGNIVVSRRLDAYRPHEIPGWEGPRSARVVESVVQAAVRSAGGFTERTRIELGSLLAFAVADSAAQLRCSTLAILDEQVERRSGADEVTETRRRTTGWRCNVTGIPDSGASEWRFRSGIAPPRDSLAAIYDSVSKVDAASIDASPPVHVERRSPGGSSTRFQTAWDPRLIVDPLWVASRLTVTRDDGRAAAVIDLGLRTRVHLAPDLSQDERQAMRFLAVLLTLAP